MEEERGKCPKCEGTGQVWSGSAPGIGTSMDCPDCVGTGEKDKGRRDVGDRREEKKEGE